MRITYQCFQDVRLIATNRPGRLELLDQGLRLGQTVQEIGRPISRRPVAINRPSRLCGRSAREWAASQSWAYLVVLYFGPSPLGFLFFPTPHSLSLSLTQKSAEHTHSSHLSRPAAAAAFIAAVL